MLLLAESGTGKELLAHAIHRASTRKEAAFVAVNCGALTGSLLESELFGYAPGAFTGARPQGAEGKLATAQSAEASFEVQPGACYVAVVTGAPSVRSFDLELVDQRGNLVAQARDQGNRAHARVCADLKARWTARARAFKGYGDYGLQVFGGP